MWGKMHRQQEESDRQDPVETIRLEGFLIEFPPKDLVELKKALVNWGYTDDSDGLKLFLMDSVKDERRRRQRRASSGHIGQIVGSFVADHPELAKAGWDLLTKKRGR
jgi:hypothetical protein